MGNYTIWALISPATWIFWTLLLWLALRQLGWRRAARTVLIIGVVAGYLVATPWFAQVLIWPLEKRFVPAPDDPPAAGIILLAGSETWSQWTPERGLQVGAAGDRFTTTLSLAATHRRAQVIFVGTPAREGKSDTQMAGAFLKPWLSDRLTLIGDTVDTCDNARAVAQSGLVTPEGRWLLVTSAAHMPRAVACFAAHGLVVEPAPADFRATRSLVLAPGNLKSYLPSGQALDTANLALHEWVGLIWYAAHDRIAPVVQLFPDSTATDASDTAS